MCNLRLTWILLQKIIIVIIISSLRVEGGRLMWSFICHTEHMLKWGLPSTQYFHPLSSCFSHVPPTEYIYMFRICQPMVDDSKFSCMLTAGTRRWSHTSFLHYTTHTHTTTVSLHRDPYLQCLPARCALSRGGGDTAAQREEKMAGGWEGWEGCATRSLYYISVHSWI